MSERAPKGLATVAQLGEFDEIIDARSPGEYADDHLPGAISCPVLSDDERVRVGTLYKQVSPFEAKKLGAVLVARNIARHVEERFLDKPRDWRPLVYCWRGGKRSGAFSHILREIGWDAHRLEGGYKAWRRQVLDDLETLPGRYRFKVVSGATGSAKSRILEALRAGGAQVLHLEELAAHKGSVLGNLPKKLAGPPQEFLAPLGGRTEHKAEGRRTAEGWSRAAGCGFAAQSEVVGGEYYAPQPSQRMFESRLHAALGALDPAQTVFAEAESRRIGTVHLPEAMIAAIRAAPCVRIEAALAARVEFLLRDYDYFLADPAALAERLAHLRPLQGHETVDRWLALIAAGDFRSLVGELLERHYDALYRRSQAANYADFDAAAAYAADDLSPAGIADLASRILAA